jgi:hypothetical protein
MMSFPTKERFRSLYDACIANTASDTTHTHTHTHHTTHTHDAHITHTRKKRSVSNTTENRSSGMWEPGEVLLQTGFRRTWLLPMEADQQRYRACVREVHPKHPCKKEERVCRSPRPPVRTGVRRRRAHRADMGDSKAIQQRYRVCVVCGGLACTAVMRS